MSLTVRTRGPMVPVHPHHADRRGRSGNLSLCWLLPALALSASAAHAGRPLATDDAGTAEAGSCQVELWQDRTSQARDTVLAPACGLPGGLEIGAEHVWPRPAADLRGAGALSLKWAPPQARRETAAGELAFGLKLALDVERPADAGLRHAGSSVLALATLRPGKDLALHLNLGLATARGSGPAAGSGWVARAALAWTPSEPWLVFAEALGNGRPAAFGSTVLATGVRRWIVPERLGLDLTLARERGGPRVLGAGLGWYGIGL